MLIKRTLTFAAAACLAGATVLVTVPATAAPASPADLAAAAQSAADAADAAFVAADWSRVQDKIDAFEDAYAELLALRDAASAEVSAAQDVVEDALAARNAAADAADAAQAALDDAEDAHDAAVDAFNASIASVLGAPAWWTAINNRPVKVSDIEASIATAQDAAAAAQAAFANAQAAVDAAQAAYDAAPSGLGKIPFVAPLATAIANRVAAQATLTAANLRVQVLTQAFDQVDGPARKQAVTDTAVALEAAESARNAALAAADEAEDAHADAVGARINAEEKLADIDALIAGLAAARNAVADRRADLVDLAHVRQVVVWTLGADNDKVRAGDLVKLNFTVPNSELFDLSDAQVTIESPKGVTPSCDIVGGVVAAGAKVSCTAEYTPTDADAKAGKVVFEVKLRGYIPLGPGNPRAQAVTRTLIETTQTLEVQVAAAVVPTSEGGSGEELADTGAEVMRGGLAAGMVAIGVALLLVRRRLEQADA